MHVHNIVGDDIVVEENSLTFEQREITRKRFLAAAMGMRLSKGKTHVVVVGTPQHPEDLLAELSDKLNTTWSKYVVPIFNSLGEPNCPELHDIIWINEQRKVVWEAIFKQEYMLQPLSLESETFGQDIIDESKDYSSIMCLEYEKKMNEKVILGVDFAIEDDLRKAQKNNTDYFAIVAILYNTQTGQRRLLNAYRDRGIKKIVQLNLLKIWAIKYNADFIGTEKHWFLAWVGQDMPKNVADILVDTGSHRGKFDLFEGIPSMLYVWEKKLYSIPYADDYSRATANILFSELRELASADHDDVADALLRAEKVIKQNEGKEIKYEKDFSIYKKLAQANIPNRLIDSRHVGYREQPLPDGRAKSSVYDTPLVQESSSPFRS